MSCPQCKVYKNLIKVCEEVIASQNETIKDLFLKQSVLEGGEPLIEQLKFKRVR